MQDILIKWLASMFEAFKAKNPVRAVITLVVAATVLNGIDNSQFYGLFVLPDWLAAAATFASQFVLAVTGTQTFRFLPVEKQVSARP